MNVMFEGVVSEGVVSEGVVSEGVMFEGVVSEGVVSEGGEDNTACVIAPPQCIETANCVSSRRELPLQHWVVVRCHGYSVCFSL